MFLVHFAPIVPVALVIPVALVVPVARVVPVFLVVLVVFVVPADPVVLFVPVDRVVPVVGGKGFVYANLDIFATAYISLHVSAPSSRIRVKRDRFKKFRIRECY